MGANQSTAVPVNTPALDAINDMSSAQAEIARLRAELDDAKEEAQRAYNPPTPANNGQSQCRALDYVPGYGLVKYLKGVGPRDYTQDQQQELEAFYAKHNPSRVASVTVILSNYSMEEITNALRKRYKKLPRGWGEIYSPSNCDRKQEPSCGMADVMAFYNSDSPAVKEARQLLEGGHISREVFVKLAQQEEVYQRSLAGATTTANQNLATIHADQGWFTKVGARALK
jgi:hypothetical protein